MNDDSLFTRTAELSSNLKQLKDEERMLSAKLHAREGYEATADPSSDNEASSVDEGQQSGDEIARLKELRAEVWGTTVELESALSEFARSELTKLESLSAAIPGRDLGAVCSAAVQTVVARYVYDFGSLLSKNNNVAHLLLEFSSHLDPEGQTVESAVTNRPDVKVLQDEDGSRYRGLRVNEQESDSLT